MTLAHHRVMTRATSVRACQSRRTTRRGAPSASQTISGTPPSALLPTGDETVTEAIVRALERYVREFPAGD